MISASTARTLERARPVPRLATPDDVHGLKRRLAPRVAELARAVGSKPNLSWCTGARWRLLVGAWMRYRDAEASGLDAPAEYARGKGYEQDLERLRAAIAKESVGPEHVTGDDPGVKVGWPSLVINYHRMWTPYVVGTARAASDCATLPVPDWTHQSQDLWTQGLQGDADSIMIDWNIHAGSSAAQILLFAGQYLEDFQHTVKRVGDFYQPHLRKYCPSIKLPDPPPFEIQNPIVSEIEDAEIVAKGVIEILEIAADGTLEVFGRVAKQVGHEVDKALNAEPLIAAAALVLGLAILIKR